MSFHAGCVVWFDSGEEGGVDTFAVIKRRLDNGNYNIEVSPDQGAPYPENDVPERAEGGGRTFHRSPLA